jgi:hypothetical protein
MANFASLWVGGPPTRLERLSVKSYLDHSHAFHLFLYDMSYKTMFPEGTIFHDAREIMPEDSVFKDVTPIKSYAQYADIFRLNMFKKYSYVWVDLDNICLSDKWVDKEPFFALMHKTALNNAVLYLDKNSELLNYMLKRCENFDYTKSIDAFELGPHLLTEAVSELKLQKNYSQRYTVYPIIYGQIDRIFLKSYSAICNSLTARAFSIHLWRTTLRDSGWLDRIPEERSFLYNLYNKHLGYSSQQDWQNL